MTLAKAVSMKYNKTIEKCSNEEIYYALLDMTKQMAEDKVSNEGKKKLYYISAEFLIGKLLSNNLINLGIYDSVKSELEASGKNIGEIEEIELEPSLGNGGLGRLAACFVDSIATLGLNGDGVGLNYHYGLFKQVFDHNLQKETPNPWITPDSWLTKTDITYPVQFGGFTVQSRLYNIDVVGYNNRTTKLRLFDIETVDESIVGDTIDFNKDDIAKNLTLFLYPDDSDDKGRLLRVYQQYFMVSNAARLILDEAVEKGSNLHDLADYATVQINDTHPSMVIPELIRLLQERGILMDEAVSIVSKVCAYTNHTILAEALEKWPIGFLEKAVPQLMPIIRELDNRVRAKVSDESTYIIKDGLVHMAHMDIHYGYSVNGVAYLHTEILKNSELNNFYKLYPEKFNNKTNGITFRRWLMSCNPELSAMITDLIGDGWKKDANELEKLGNFVNDDAVLDRLLAVKAGKKADLKNYLKMKQDSTLLAKNILIEQQKVEMLKLHEGRFFWIGVCVLVLVIACFIYLYEKKRRALLLAQSQRTISSLRLENIRNRMSPHFIFNVLNQEMGSREGENKKELSSLVKLMRRNLELAEQMCVTLKEELGFVQTYIDLQRRSLGPEFKVTIEVGEDVDTNQLLLPSMLIQIPVENAIKHALQGKEGERRLWIDVHRSGTYICVRITDNGGGFKLNSANRGTGTGMKVIMQTIQILNAKNKEMIETTVHNIPLPDGETACEVSFHLPLNYDYSV